MEFEEALCTPRVFLSDDNSIPANGYLARYDRAFTSALEKTGFKLDIAECLEGYLAEVGFVDIKVVVKKLVIGPWAKEAVKKVCCSRGGAGDDGSGSDVRIGDWEVGFDVDGRWTEFVWDGVVHEGGGVVGGGGEGVV